jgi:hypothetical protein
MHKLSLTSQKKWTLKNIYEQEGHPIKKPNLRKFDMHQLILGSKAKSSTKFL